MQSDFFAEKLDKKISADKVPRGIDRRATSKTSLTSKFIGDENVDMYTLLQILVDWS